MKNLPFDITPQILRYLRNLVELHENFLAADLGEPVAVDNYTSTEEPTYKAELNNNAFWDYLESKNAIERPKHDEIKKRIKFRIFTMPQLSSDLVVTDKHWVIIKNIEFINNLLLANNKYDVNSSPSGKIFIEKLEVVRPNNKSNKFLIIVNENYEHQKQISGDRAKPSWDMLFRIAAGEELMGSNFKPSLEYFNTNKLCKLYTQTGCSLTKIFKTEYRITALIPIVIITEKAFKQRQNKSRKTT